MPFLWIMKTFDFLGLGKSGENGQAAFYYLHTVTIVRNETSKKFDFAIKGGTF